MKKQIPVFLIILFFVATIPVKSQDSTLSFQTKPFLEISINGSFNLALLDLKGSDNIRGFWGFKDYGVSTGFGTNAELKIGLLSTKKSQVKIHIMLGYSHFANDDNRAYSVHAVESGWPYTVVPNSNIKFVPRDTAGTSYLRFNMPSLALGMEYSIFVDRGNKSSFNFGMDFLSTIITGRVYETIQNTKELYVTLYPSLRFGIGLNASYSYRFSNRTGFNIGTRFSMPNLLGKSSEMTDKQGYMSLLDDGNTALNHNLITKRTIGYLQFFGGVSFYLGKM